MGKTNHRWGNASKEQRSQRAKLAAERRRCPECKRKGALVKLPRAFFGYGDPIPPVVRECRFCGYSGTLQEIQEKRKGVPWG